MSKELTRCSWCGTAEDYVAYHDNHWGRPVADSRELFEKLCLDGQQAGLSWITILRKQETYREAYRQFDPAAIVAMPEAERSKLIENPGIIRNKLKIASVFKNAEAYLRLAEQGIPFNEYLWKFVGGAPIINAWRVGDEFPTRSEASDAMAKALKKDGFNFVGTTICYAFMQAVGMVNDHRVDCHCYEPVCAEMRAFNL